MTSRSTERHTERGQAVAPSASIAGEEHSLGRQSAPPTGSSRPQLSQVALTERARDGDVEAFAALVSHHEAELFRLTYRMLADRQAAQDVVIETLTEGWRRLPASPKTASFRIWMARTALQSCLKIMARRNHVGANHSVPDPPRTESDLVTVSQDGGTLLDAVLTRLSPQQRACWVLKDLHGLSDADISYVMGVPRSSVAQRTAVSRRHLLDAFRTSA